VRFLADESCDFAVVRALRGAGHDVSAVTELSPAAKDDALSGFTTVWRHASMEAAGNNVVSVSSKNDVTGATQITP